MNHIEPQAPAAPGDRLRVELHLRYRPNGLSGTVGCQGDPPLAFAGWIGLLAALDQLRHRDPDHPGSVPHDLK